MNSQEIVAGVAAAEAALPVVEGVVQRVEEVGSHLIADVKTVMHFKDEFEIPPVGTTPQPAPTTKLETTLVTRADRYGDFHNVAQISQDFLAVARGAPSWDEMGAFQKEGITMILHKLARALSGDPDYVDNWHDVAGYAKLVEDRLPKAG